MVEDETAGDPMNDKKWVRRTVRQIRKALKQQGYHLSRSTVWRLLKQWGYALRSNRKRFTGADQPERGRQLRYIGRVKRLFVAAGGLTRTDPALPKKTNC